jgi:hypothetical protein
MRNTYAILMMVLYTLFRGHQKSFFFLHATTCTIEGLRFTNLTARAQTLHIQGRWSLGTTYVNGAGPLRPNYLLQLGAYLPMYPFGCVLVVMNGRVFPYPSEQLVIPAETTEIRLFYNICPFLFSFLTPHLLVYLEPTADHVIAAVGH